MTITETAFEAEDLALQAWGINGVLLSIQTAISSGAYTAEAYEPAIFVLSNMTADLENRLKQITKALFAAANAETAKGV